MRTVWLAGLVVIVGAGAVGVQTLAGAAQRCPVTVPAARTSPGAGVTTQAFNYGSSELRASLYWRAGVLRAGTLPGGGSMATIEGDGSVTTKVDWWRKRGRLVVTGRRLDASARPLTASVPGGYGDSGFQSTRLRFPSAGCWRVTGAAGGAQISFVVRVFKPERSLVRFGAFGILVPSAWRWRSPPGFPGQVLQLSNDGLRLPNGGDPIKEARIGTFVLTLAPAGIDGSPTPTRITRRDFLAQDALQRPRGRDVANDFYCAPSGPCVAISLVYRGDRMPDRLLADVNRVLGSLRPSTLG